MKVAIIAQAKNEDLYVEEWLDFHFKLGIDDIFLIQHAGWKYKGQHFDGLHLQEASIEDSQHEIVNEWLDRCRHSYDWLFFIDIDEFICLKNGENSIKDFLKHYDEFNGICFNWRIFGDSGLEENGDYGVIRRFTRCSSSLDPCVKLALHTSICPDDVHLDCVHGTMIGLDIKSKIVMADKICNVTKKHCQDKPGFSKYDLEECKNIAYLAHYKNKTYAEFVKRTNDKIGYFLFSSKDEIHCIYSRWQ